MQSVFCKVVWISQSDEHTFAQLLFMFVKVLSHSGDLNIEQFGWGNWTWRHTCLIWKASSVLQNWKELERKRILTRGEKIFQVLGTTELPKLCLFTTFYNIQLFMWLSQGHKAVVLGHYNSYDPWKNQLFTFTLKLFSDTCVWLFPNERDGNHFVF